MRKRSFIVSGLLLLMLSLTISAAVAQELCETLVRDAWEEIQANCSANANLNACYGFDSLDATFNQVVDAKTFSKPSDVIQLPELHTVHTLPFDAEQEEWGVSDFLIDATAFGGSAGEAIIIFTTGDTIVENAVEPGSDLQPMQAFNFTTGGKSDCKDAPNAVFIQAPKGLKVDLTINSTPIRIGSTIVLGTQNADDGHDLMYFSVLEGSLTINPDTPEQQVVHQGEFTTTILSDAEGKGLAGEQKLNGRLVPVLDPQTGEPVVGPDGEPFYRQIPVEDFAPSEPITFDGNDFGGWDAYRFFTLIPGSLLNYTVDLPTEQIVANIPSPKPTPASTESTIQNWCDPGGPWDDGRCNDPNPDIAAWLWQAGWYNEQFEQGNIPFVPDEYAPPTPAPVTVTSGGTTQPLFKVVQASCIDSSLYPPGQRHDYVFSLANVPAGTAQIDMDFATQTINVSYSGQASISQSNVLAIEDPVSGARAVDGGGNVIQTAIFSVSDPC